MVPVEYQCFIAMLGYLKLHPYKLVDSMWEPSIQHSPNMVAKKMGGNYPSIFTEAARGVGQRIVYGSSMGGPCATSTLEKLCTTHLQMVLRYTLIIYIYIIYLIIQFIPQDQLLFPPWTIEEKLMSHWMNQWIDFLILKPHGWPHPVVKCYWYYLKN